MSRASNAAAARLQIIAAAALFSTGGTAIKLSTLTGLEVAGLRSAFAAIALALLMPRLTGVPLARPDASSLWVAAAYGATMVLFVVANKLTTAANTIFLQSTAPLYVLLLGPWLLAERVSVRDLPFIAALAVGMGLFFVGVDAPLATAPDPGRGDVVAALSGVLWALTIVGLRRLGAAGASATPALVMGNVLAFAISLAWLTPLTAIAAADWLVVVYLGLIQIALAYVLLSAGVARVRALEASLLLLLEPVLSAVWAWAVLGETPGPFALAGGTIIVVTTAARAMRYD